MSNYHSQFVALFVLLCPLMAYVFSQLWSWFLITWITPFSKEDKAIKTAMLISQDGTAPLYAILLFVGVALFLSGICCGFIAMFLSSTSSEAGMEPTKDADIILAVKAIAILIVASSISGLIVELLWYGLMITLKISPP